MPARTRSAADADLPNDDWFRSPSRLVCVPFLRILGTLTLMNGKFPAVPETNDSDVVQISLLDLTGTHYHERTYKRPPRAAVVACWIGV